MCVLVETAVVFQKCRAMYNHTPPPLTTPPPPTVRCGCRVRVRERGRAAVGGGAGGGPCTAGGGGAAVRGVQRGVQPPRRPHSAEGAHGGQRPWISVYTYRYRKVCLAPC